MFKIPPDSLVLFVGDAEVDNSVCVKDHVDKAEDVLHVGGGIYDVIVFCGIPPLNVLERAIEKVYWGGYVIIQLGIARSVAMAGYEVISSSVDDLALRRPLPPPIWSREYYLEFQPFGSEWDSIEKLMATSYREKFANIAVNWKDTVVAEYGCGRGEITRLIALSGAKRVYAVDLSATAIELTDEFCDDLDNVSLVCANALTWNAPELLDVIIALDFVEHIEPEHDLPKMLELWYNNLRKGGIVHIFTPLGRDAVRDHKWGPTPDLLRRKMEDVGFETRRVVRPEKSRKFFAEFVKE